MALLIPEFLPQLVLSLKSLPVLLELWSGVFWYAGVFA
jgi:hypothetical protein